MFKISSCLKASAVQMLLGSGSLQIELPWHLQSDLLLSVCFKFNKVYSSHIWPQSAPINFCAVLEQNPPFHTFFFWGLILTQSRMLPKYSANATRLWNGITRCQKHAINERENSGCTFSVYSFFHSVVINIIKKPLLEQFSRYSERVLNWWNTALCLKTWNMITARLLYV